MEADVGSLIFDGLLILGGSFLFARSLGRRRRITRTPTSRIADAPGDGLVEIKGRVVAGSEGPISAPVTGRACVWVRTVVTEGKGKKTTTLFEQIDFRSFLVEDGSGEAARILLEGASIDATTTTALADSPELLSFVAERNLWRVSGALSCEQAVLGVGDLLYAIGPSRREVGPPVHEGYRSASGTQLVLHAAPGKELLVSNKTEEALVSRLTWNMGFFSVLACVGLVLALFSFGRGEVVSRASHPSAIAVDDTGVYWTNWGSPRNDRDGAVVKVSLAGGSPTILASNRNHPVAVTVHRGDVYWADFGSSQAPFGNGAVSKVPAAGGAVTTIAAEQSHVTAIAVDDQDVYWTAFVWNGEHYEGVVMKAPVDGGTPVTIASDPNPSWLGAGVAVDAKSVYWTTRESISKAPLEGGTPLTIASEQRTIGSEIVVLGTNVYYWVGDTSEAAVKKVSTSGGPAVTLATTHGLPAGLAVSATDVFFSIRKNSMKRADPDGLLRVPIDGGTATRLYDHVCDPGALALEDGSLYWTEANGRLFSGDGRIARLALR